MVFGVFVVVVGESCEERVHRTLSFFFSCVVDGGFLHHSQRDLSECSGLGESEKIRLMLPHSGELHCVPKSKRVSKNVRISAFRSWGSLCKGDL